MIYIIAITLLVLMIGFVALGFITSNKLEAKEYTVNNSELEGIIITHITDIHIGDYFTEEDLSKTVTLLNNQESDITFFTGDLFEINEISNELKQQIIDELSLITTPLKYAVLGNHDSHTDNKKDIVKDILVSSGFIVLENRNEIITINSTEINIIGLEDYMMGDDDYEPVLSTSNDNTLNIVLSHEPDTFDQVSDYPIIAQFSGHSHGGQVRFPIIGGLYKVTGAKIYSEDYYTKNNSELFISFGLGASMIDIRFYNSKSINTYTFK